MRLTAASKDQLLGWAAKYLTTCADQLERSYFSPSQGTVIPKETGYEIRKLRNWVNRADLLLNSKNKPATNVCRICGKADCPRDHGP